MPNLHTLHPDRQFTQISNEAADLLPSIHGLGYLVHLLRHRDGYVPNLEKLVEQKPGVTKRDASKARAEVMEQGFYVSVRFKHSDGGQFETDIWRSVYPHSAEDLDEIAQRYRPGNVTQIAQKGTGRKPRRDAHGNVLMRQVTIQWARVDSWRGKQRVSDDGQLCAPDTDVKADAARAEAPNVRGTESGTSARPAKTRVSAGGSEVPDSEGSDTRGVGEREVIKKTTQNTTKEHSPDPALRSGSGENLFPSGSIDEVQTAHAATDERTENLESEHNGTPRNEGARLVADPVIQSDLTRIDLWSDQRRQLEDAVDTALIRFPRAQVQRYLRAKAHQANTATWLIGAFTQCSDAIKQVNVPDRDHHRTDDDQLLDQLAARTPSWERMPEPSQANQTSESPQRSEGQRGADTVEAPRASEQTRAEAKRMFAASAGTKTGFRRSQHREYVSTKHRQRVEAEQDVLT